MSQSPEIRSTLKVVISRTRHRGSLPRSPLDLRFVPSLILPIPIPNLTANELSLLLTMSPRSSPSASLKSSPLEKCPGAPDLRALACPVFPPFELYLDDSVEIPSMSEGTSAETSLDLPSPTPEPTSRVLRVLTTSLKRSDPQRGRASPNTTRQFHWIDLVKQGGATPEALLHHDLPSDNELRLFLDDLIPGSSSSLVSQDSVAFEDDLPPPCLLHKFSSLSKHSNRASPAHSRSHSRNPTKRGGTPLTEPETPKDDDVFFHHDSQTSSRTSLCEEAVGCFPLVCIARPHSPALSQDVTEAEDKVSECEVEAL